MNVSGRSASSHSRYLTYVLRIVKFTPEEIERLKTDDEYYKHFRWTVEHDINVTV